jgi:hypothetical protein
MGYEDKPFSTRCKRTERLQLVFLLFYFRHYPTQETLAFLFGLSQGQACQWIHRLTRMALGFSQSTVE